MINASRTGVCLLLLAMVGILSARESGSGSRIVSSEEASRIQGGISCDCVNQAPNGCTAANRAKGDGVEHCSTAGTCTIVACWSGTKGNTNSVSNGSCVTPCAAPCGGMQLTGWVDCAGVNH